MTTRTATPSQKIRVRQRLAELEARDRQRRHENDLALAQVRGTRDGFRAQRGVAHSYCSRYLRTTCRASTFRTRVTTNSTRPRANAESVFGLSNSRSPISRVTI